VLTPFEPGELPEGTSVRDISSVPPGPPGGEVVVEIIRADLDPPSVIAGMRVSHHIDYYLYQTADEARSAYDSERFMLEDATNPEPPARLSPDSGQPRALS
jgi:hypothetical protein